MKEARIVCRVQTGYRVSDVTPSLSFEYQQEVFLPESVVNSSKQIMQAVKAGALVLQWVERYQMKKNEVSVPPWLRQRGKSHNRSLITDKPAPEIPVKPLIEEGSKVLNSVQSLVSQATQAMDQNTRALIEKMQADLAKVVQEAVAKEAAKTEKLIQEALAARVAEPQYQPSHTPLKPEVFLPHDEVEFGSDTFIPSSLSLRDVGTVSVKVSSEEVSVGNVDEALEALQKKRRSKK